MGQSTITSLTGAQATGETYCLVHRVTIDGSKRRLMVASLRYNDTFLKHGRRMAVFGAPVIRGLG